MVSPVMVRLKQPLIKIILISICALLLLLVLLNLYLDPIVKTLFIQQTAPLFGDNLSVESIHFSILRGAIILKNITLKQPPGFGEGHVLKAGIIKIQVKLSELFQKKLVFERIVSKQPQIHLVQLPTGRINLEYYADSLKKSATKPQSSPENEPFRLFLKELQLTKGELILTSSRLSNHQPALVLRDLSLEISEFKIPNPDRQSASFKIAGLISAAHPARFDVQGNGVFLSGTLNFSSNTQLTGLYLREYTALFPPSNWTIQRGVASVTAETNCRDNYLTSHQYVKISDLKIAPKNKNVFRNVFFGLPSQAMIALLEDQNGALDFSFDVQGTTSHLKVFLKESVSKAVFRSIFKKVGGYGVSGNKTLTKLKESGQKIKNSFKKLFKK